ncbi:MAG: MarR family transcriptional regulator [Rhizobium sp.]|jgi:DNA-binding MarR family transcriptional regulator|nr:MarR family transcriptional regulator [Rhizobium sp.]
MAKRPVSATRASSGRSSKAGSQGGANATGQNQDLVREFIWDIVSINTHLEEIRYLMARMLGISGPQWLILMAINDLDRGNGVSVRVVSEKLHVDPSFVTTQSKSLEKHGFMRRISSVDDARVVLMSLTDKASKQIASLSSHQERLNDFIFADLDERALGDITGKLTTIKNRLEKASLRFATEI